MKFKLNLGNQKYVRVPEVRLLMRFSRHNELRRVLRAVSLPVLQVGGHLDLAAADLALWGDVVLVNLLARACAACSFAGVDPPPFRQRHRGRRRLHGLHLRLHRLHRLRAGDDLHGLHRLHGRPEVLRQSLLVLAQTHGDLQHFAVLRGGCNKNNGHTMYETTI